MGRKLNLDCEQIENMAAEFCTQEEIAADLGFDRTAFHRHPEARAAFARGQNTAKMSLRHMMWKQACSGDRTMMIFLAKNELGYRDNPPEPETAPSTVDGVNAQIHSIANLINSPQPNRPIE